MQQTQEELTKTQRVAQDASLLTAQVERMSTELALARTNNAIAETHSREREREAAEAHAKLAATQAELASLREVQGKEDKAKLVDEVRELRGKAEEFKKRQMEWEESETKLQDVTEIKEKVWAQEKAKLEASVRQLTSQVQDAQVPTHPTLKQHIHQTTIGQSTSPTHGQSGSRKERLTAHCRIGSTARTSSTCLGQSGTRSSS